MAFRFRASDYPQRPGCYLMKDREGTILYIGKSVNLRNRLRSYFAPKQERRGMTEMIARVASIEVVLVNNESESLILENNLIKIHKPPYNRALKKDNSGFAYLLMTDERLPRLDVYYRDRRPSSARGEAAGNRPAAPGKAEGPRFGPYSGSHFRNAVMLFVNDHFQLRTCVALPKRACLLYHIGRCSGVCEGHISEAGYRESAEAAARLLEKGGEKLLAAMYEAMERYAERLQFEKAAHVLTHIRILEKLPDKQIVDREGTKDQDILYFGERSVLVAKVQEGMLRDFRMHALERDAFGEHAADSFLLRHYRDSRPDELIVNRVADAGMIKSALRSAGRDPLMLTVPRRGLKRDLLELCRQNYEYRMEAAAGLGEDDSADDAAAPS